MGASRREPWAGELDERQLLEARTVRDLPTWSPPPPVASPTPRWRLWLNTARNRWSALWRREERPEPTGIHHGF